MLVDDPVTPFEAALREHGDRILRNLERASPFAGLPTFAGAPHTRDLAAVHAAVVGLPFDSGTSYRPGARHGPRAVREHSRYAAGLQPVYPWSTDLRRALRLVDWGDVAVVPGSQAVELMLAAAKEVAGRVLDAGASLLCLGGDHTVSYGPIRAAARRFGPLALVHLDAHQDSVDSDAVAGLPMVSHGSFATDLVNEGAIDARRSMQIFVRTRMAPTPGGHMVVVEAAEAAGLGARALAARIRELAGGAPVYLTLDVDALDPAYAPGTGTPVPGGPSSAEVRALLHALEGIDVVAADLVEVNPLLDPTQTTAITAAYLALDLVYLLAAARRADGVAARRRERRAHAPMGAQPVEERPAAAWAALSEPPEHPVVFRGAAAEWRATAALQPGRLVRPPLAREVVGVKRCGTGERRTVVLGDVVTAWTGAVRADDPWYVTDWALSAMPGDVLAGCELPAGVDNWLDELADAGRADWTWLFVGPAGSYTAMHEDVLHSAAWNAVLAGRKVWRLAAPGDGGPQLRCEQHAGDILVTPGGWRHGAVNEELTVALTGNFVNGGNVDAVLEHLDAHPVDAWATMIRRLHRRRAAGAQ